MVEGVDEGRTGMGGAALLKVLDSALRQAEKMADKHLDYLRRQYPKAGDAVLLKKLERTFISTVTTSGAALGATATVPAAGATVAVAVAVGNTGIFFTAAATHLLAVARLRNLQLQGFEHERTLLLMVLMGGSSSSIVSKVAERTGVHWGKKAANAVPMPAIRSANKILGQHFLTRCGTKQGILVLGQAAPLGFGAVIGGGGNYLLAKSVAKVTITTIDNALQEGAVQERHEDLSVSS
ncbi:hypothetical protein [Kocuria arenosa]|uniref:hypothetical protein n=1 Tax=Kocuria arenosa TaxID=3071446 RepID=UPI0034D70962